MKRYIPIKNYSRFRINSLQPLPAQITIEVAIIDETRRVSRTETGTAMTDNARRDYKKIRERAILNAIYKNIQRGTSMVSFPLSKQDYNIIQQRYKTDVINEEIDYIVLKGRKIEKRVINGKPYNVVYDETTGKIIAKKEFYEETKKE